MQQTARECSIHFIESILGNIRHIIDGLIQTNNLLNNVKNHLHNYQIEQNFKNFIVREFQKSYSSAELLQQIEKELGYSLNHWGRQYHIDGNLILNILYNKITKISVLILKKIDKQLSISS